MYFPFSASPVYGDQWILNNNNGDRSSNPSGPAMDSGEDPDALEAHRNKKKRHHRHTARQIQELESMFKECPHPDEKQRMQLSRDLGLEPRQIKFWFQNRRTQMKAQHERADNCILRSENDKIRCENIAMREALKNIICPSCGGPPLGEDSYFDEQKLRMENVRLKDERLKFFLCSAKLERVSTMASKYVGRPISHFPPVQPIPISSLDLSVGSHHSICCGGGGGGHAMMGLSPPSLDLDLLHGSSSSAPALHVPPSMGMTEMEKSLMAELASAALDEAVRLLRADEPFWVRSGGDGGEVLDLDSYSRSFAKLGPAKSPDVRVEASRDSGLVFMRAHALIDMLMDSMNEELQVLSPLVATREFNFLRYCQQIEPGLWAIADVSVDLSSRETMRSAYRKLPSGCLIQEMPNGNSKVTWMEHMEIDERTLPHRLYRELLISGLAFGAERWLANLRRMCERFASLTLTGTSTRELGVIPSAEGKRSMMKLSHRMISNFCASISASNGDRWTALSGSGSDDIGVRISVHKSTDPGRPNGVVLSAATSLWLPVPCQNVFNFFKDERTRAQWDVLSNGSSVQEVAHIANGSHPGNCISLLRAFNASENNMLILQESCTDASGSLVVYAPVELPAINVAMSGEDPSYIPLLPSGFTITPDGRAPDSSASISSSHNGGRGGGSLITVAFQILVSSLPSAKLNAESVNTVNNLISTTVQQIKAGLNCNT
ncbi:Homeobox-leucine zipper protein ROC8 [Acorus calamus]|uniref:Homeobox-leucine zipper protein ROC8 n=1 Tax=Acorus calamus TaxID=4465 RepID=A0AAV9DJZ1_ACOCL|nr:Homeobox-leucine zipper protein ROC8 [Acorus calamus]